MAGSDLPGIDVIELLDVSEFIAGAEHEAERHGADVCRLQLGPHLQMPRGVTVDYVRVWIVRRSRLRSSEQLIECQIQASAAVRSIGVRAVRYLDLVLRWTVRSPIEVEVRARNRSSSVSCEAAAPEDRFVVVIRSVQYEGEWQILQRAFIAASWQRAA